MSLMFLFRFFAEVKKKQDAEAAEKAALDRGEFDRQSKDQVKHTPRS